MSEKTNNNITELEFEIGIIKELQSLKYITEEQAMCCIEEIKEKNNIKE